MTAYHLCRDEANRSHGVIICRVHAYERLEEADQNDDQEGKEDQRLFHHDLHHCQKDVLRSDTLVFTYLEHNKHGTKESEAIKIEQQS